MNQDPVIFSFPKLSLHARQFEIGAKASSSDGGATVVIDVFRASNTILELITAGASVRPVMTIEEARDSKYDEYLRIGEEMGRAPTDFAFDNSPVQINENADKVKDQKVVLRTSNGTRGILSALGSQYIIVGTFRNFTAVVDYLLNLRKENNSIPISFVGMGTKEHYRIEDAYCAQMFMIRLLEELGEKELLQKIEDNGKNPFSRDWRKEIMNERGDNQYALRDYEFSLLMDQSKFVPRYNPTTGFLDIDH